MCQNLRSRWNAVAKFARAKPRALQRAIAGQLMEYTKVLKEKEKKWQANEEMAMDPIDEILERDGQRHHEMNEDEKENEGRTEVMLDCIGQRCHLEQYQKQFRSVSKGGRTGPKKCPSCRAFEPALKKALLIEKYILDQLETPTDDIHKLLEGLSYLMVDSTRAKIPRSVYYDQVLKIEEIQNILKLPKNWKPDGTCPPSAKMAISMLAPTFGIALDGQATCGPFPGMNHEEVATLWNIGVTEPGGRDTWGQLCWFLENMSITMRLDKLEQRVVPINQQQKRALQRAEKGRRLEGSPTSLATVIPKRKRGGWDATSAKKKSKLATIDAALDIVNGSNENLLQEIHQANIKRGYRETAKKKPEIEESASSTRVALGDMTNKSQRNGVESNANQGNQNNGTTRKRNAPGVSATRQLQMHTRSTEAIRMETPIDLSSDDEEEELSDEAKRKPTLYGLTATDLASISTTEQHVRGSCIQALIETLHENTSRDEISCVSTDFYSYLIDGRYAEAKQLLHPDERCAREPTQRWETPHHRIATARSRVLLIPCHILGKTTDDADHWALTVRIKQRNGGYKLYIFDSLGKKNGQHIQKTLWKPLKKMELIGKKEACEVLDTCAVCRLRESAVLEPWNT
jgi:hypothetical protein